jgi:non-ribosomal peptide synthetase component E (peptide arylation enzyme)
VGVDEVACLIDFGVPFEAALAGLGRLAELRERSRESPAAAGTPESIPALVLDHAVTHLQCTPSTVTAFLADAEAPAALARLDRLLVGGEALPPALAERVRGLLRGELRNM